MRASRAAAIPFKMCTRVCRRFAVLAFWIIALVPRPAAADPLFMGATGDACTGLVPSTTLNCGLFAIDNPLLSPTVTGTFQADNDVALFQFLLTGAATVTAFTTGFA